MKVFVSANHDQFWPVGCASVAVAENEDEARRLLDAALAAKGLKTGAGKPYTLCEVAPGTAVVLADGEY